MREDLKTEYHILKNATYNDSVMQIHAAIEHSDNIYTLESCSLNPSVVCFCSIAKNGSSHSNYKSQPVSLDPPMQILEAYLLNMLKATVALEASLRDIFGKLSY